MKNTKMHKGKPLLALIYSVVVAGKSAVFANSVIDKLCNYWHDNAFVDECFHAFLERLDNENRLFPVLKLIKSGNYNKVYKSIVGILNSNVNLETCTPQDLESIHGIGPKTSRFFVLWTRPRERYAILDVHILRWMHGLGYDVPLHTPQSTKKYDRIEKIFLDICRNRKISPRELDLEIWEAKSTAKNIIKEI